MTVTPTEPEPARELPTQRAGAPKAGQKRRRYLRWKRVASIATVLALIGFGVAASSVWFDQTKDEGIRASEALLDDLSEAIDAHFRRVGELPGPDLKELSHPSSPYRGAVPPEDAYGSLIEYVVIDGPQGDFCVRSAGADRIAGTHDDILRPLGARWP